VHIYSDLQYHSNDRKLHTEIIIKLCLKIEQQTINIRHSLCKIDASNFENCVAASMKYSFANVNSKKQIYKIQKKQAIPFLVNSSSLENSFATLTQHFANCIFNNATSNGHIKCTNSNCLHRNCFAGVYDLSFIYKR
jgi:hypothetical protein